MSRIPAAKRRRISPPDSEDATTRGRQHAFVANSQKWDLEEDYANRRRKLKAKRKENTKLPVRTSEGWIQQEVEPEHPQEDKSEDSGSFSGSDVNGDGDGGDEIEEVLDEEVPKVSQRQQIIEAKEEVARIASLINEDPEEHIGALRTLAQLASSKNTTVRKLALASQVAVFKDLIPGYRIRPIPEDATTKLSKEVRKLRNFEQKLLLGYQTYIKELTGLAKQSGSTADESANLATVAIGCTCSLLIAVPHFNFRSDLLQILVSKLSTNSVDADFIKCRETLEALFRSDEDSNATLDAVTMLTKMMKARNYHVDESVLNTFLHLRVLSEFSYKASYNSVDKPADEEQQGKKIKQKREFRTKRQRKDLKERKAIEKEMKEADAVVSYEEREKMQAETLKMVFVAYFRILKARSDKLMGAVLEGLARYAHLINQDFFGDILEALRDLIAHAETSAQADLDDDGEEPEEEESQRNATRESLLCVITAFALLQGQDAAAAASTLKLDLSFFITHLYRTLHLVSLNPDIELSSKSLHLADPNNLGSASVAENKVNVQTTIVLLIRSLSSVLLPPTALRAVPPIRIGAFCKQLMTISLQLPEKSSVAMLGLLTKVTKMHGRKIGALWNTEERRGDGIFHALKPEIEGCNPFASTVWEGELLRKHFCPTVREAVVGIEKNILESR